MAVTARRTILSDDAVSVLILILEDIAGWDGAHIRALFEAHGLRIQEWNKVRTDWLTLLEERPDPAAPELMLELPHADTAIEYLAAALAPA